MAESPRLAARRAPECAVLLLVCVAACAGFTIHQRHPHLHPHHHLRHHGHHPHHKVAPESTVSPEPTLHLGGSESAAEAVAVDALLEALASADFDDTVWGSGGDDQDAGVPLFMKMLLRDTEEGAVYGEYSQPVAAATTPGANKKTLASCVQPSRVSVGRGGVMVVEFPRADGADSTDSNPASWWLVLSPQSRYTNALREDGLEADLLVYVADPEPGAAHDGHDQVQLIAEHRLPNASFIAVDVTRVMNDTAGGSWPRFLLDVKAHERDAGSVSAATALEVAGWERGPLLVRALDWGSALSAPSATGGPAPAAAAPSDVSFRVWRDVPQDVLHPPRVRSRRRSRRRTTTTERPGFTSAENPLRNAAAEEIRPGSDEEADQADREYCRLEAWTVSVADLGWDFVVQPRSLDINFCVGRCPPLLLDAQRFNASTNAVARMAIKRERGADAGANIPDAQCVPIRYKPIAMIMRNKGRTDLFTSYDLSADRCGCR